MASRRGGAVAPDHTPSFTTTMDRSLALSNCSILSKQMLSGPSVLMPAAAQTLFIRSSCFVSQTAVIPPSVNSGTCSGAE